MSRLALILTLAAAAPALAQTPNSLVGLTRNGGDLRQQSHTACAVLNQCSPAGFPSAAGLPLNAGGTAWDAIHGAAWISNGRFVACVDDACNYLCTPVLLPGLGAGVVVSGLEAVTKRQQLWAIDSADNLRVLDMMTCPPAPVSTCPVAFPLPLVTGGLAVDELADLVFFARHDPATGLNYIAISSLQNPCTLLSTQPLPPCAIAMTAITGLAVDSVARLIYATNGERTMAISYVPLVGVGAVFTNATCCPPMAGNVDPLVGLALRPGRATQTGVACSAAACPACPMNHGLDGDSVLGNANFQLRLGGAPAGSFAWCMVGDGPCVPAGVVVPPLCGPAHTLPLLGILGANLTVGAGCGASADFPLPIPASAGLGGIVLSSQCFVWCPFGAGGTAMSPCLSFELQGL